MKSVQKIVPVILASLFLVPMQAQKKGLGVVALGSKMIDAPVVKRAQRIIDQINK